MRLTRPLSFKDSKRLILFGVGALLLVGIDLLTKWLAEIFLVEGELNAIIPNFLYFTKSYNTAVAFSLGSSLPMPVGRAINITISVVMSVAILWYWILNDDRFNNFQRSIAMLLAAGAVGNLIDRAFYWEAITGFDGVIDFIQFYLGGGPSAPNNFVNPFATFNLADSYLTIGIIMLIVLMVIDMIKESKNGGLSKDPRIKDAPKQSDAEKSNDAEGHN
ncbi:MAG: signal peptidase II [Bacillales bacterium]|nr:signal peptidase II [Bacillales bacterium]MDY5920350.1 signal peptidase II [Candidatus Enteromonas sp.]